MPIKVELVIKDTLAFWRDEIGTHTYDPDGFSQTNTWIYAVPDAAAATLIVDGTLTEAGLERCYERLYGPTWRIGNDDGSKYVVLACTTRVLPADDPRPARPLAD